MKKLSIILFLALFACQMRGAQSVSVSTITLVNPTSLRIPGSVSVGGPTTNNAPDTTTPAVRIKLPANFATNALEIADSAGNVIAAVSSSGVYRSTNDFFATLTTTDNTTNVIYSFTTIQDSAVRVSVYIVGFNSTSSASYEKAATFKNVAGTVSQVGGSNTFGSNEDDTAFEALITFSGSTVQIKVAGNTGKTVKWTANGKLSYAQ